MTGESVKVVGYLITWYDTMYRGKTTVSSAPCNKDDGVSEPLVTLTDHEAALAELRSDVERLTACAGVLQERVDHFAQIASEELRAHEDTKASYETLLTGLEALAGEWMTKAEDYDKRAEVADCAITREWFEEMSQGHIDCANALTRTLASSATGEKNTEEEMK